MINIGPITEILLESESREYRKYGVYPFVYKSTKRYIKSLKKHFSEFYPGTICYKTENEYVFFIPKDYESVQYKNVLKSIIRCSSDRCPICKGVYVDAPKFIYDYVMVQLKKEVIVPKQVRITPYDKNRMIGYYPEIIYFDDIEYKLSKDGGFYLCTF